MAQLLCIGDLNADVTVGAGDQIAPGSDTQGVVALAAGGSAANVAAGAAAAGVATRFVGVVGDDLLGRLLVDELAGHGVEVRPIVRRGAASRAIAALISSTGERSMVSDLSSATVLRVSDVDPQWFEGVDWLHLTAYSWFPDGGDDLLARLCGLAHERGIGWSIDPSSAQMLRASRSVQAALTAFDRAAVMFPSLDEAAALSGVDDPTESATRLLDVAETVVVTCGADGAVVASRFRPPFAVAAIDVGVDVVNTLGAGDAFAAGFIAARLAGSTDEACASSGLRAAAAAVARPTAR
ncbi:MAG: PfkB family carbohydrate kinase [Ilumatobacter sp.]|uniref:carbohydrate kinase family protein n=1 Tax=Ilumatobacter sp. TaxID=1967498 RepID=UPI00329A7C38